MPDSSPHSDRRAEAWSRIDTTKTEDMVPSSELRGWLAEYVGLFEQFEAVVEATRFKPGEDCWCSFRQVDAPDWHSPDCVRVRQILGVSNPASSLDLTLRCPTCGKRADMCFEHGDEWKKRDASDPAKERLNLSDELGGF